MERSRCDRLALNQRLVPERIKCEMLIHWWIEEDRFVRRLFELIAYMIHWNTEEKAMKQTSSHGQNLGFQRGTVRILKTMGELESFDT